MKKILLSTIALSAIMAAGTMVYADGTYDNETNTVSMNNEAEYKTVLIAKNTGRTMVDSDIVYIGQEKEGFNSIGFKLKSDLAPGYYTIMIGNDNDVPKSAKFFIGTADSFEKVCDLKVLEDYEKAGENGTVTKVYISEDELTLADIKSIVVRNGEKVLFEGVGTEFSGSGAAKIACELTDISQEDKDSISISISSTEIIDAPLMIN